VFIGSNEQAIQQAQQLGIKHTSLHAPTKAGTSQQYAVMARSLTSYRGGTVA
jgi:hypothetical protein